MKILILCVGKLKEEWLKLAEQEFLKRLSLVAKIEIQELKSSKYDDQRAIKEEEEYLQKVIQDQDFVCVLERQGKELNSQQFAENLDKWRQEGKRLVFIIGGAQGISEKIQNRANFLWSFSPLTFTHQMIRALLLEQIYRSTQIWQNTGYHK
ncbi:MAG TPA: 23S rRNA (pseudouridine(1915)-N(3))-methyltransferase RlmH [Candidatus Gracilibacteria bacterium]|nr:23S rRNA (pseudouridine(1915)-N(3))-methyltransferase RlmH [Candidatus Gracilibacteria bacterium]